MFFSRLFFFPPPTPLMVQVSPLLHSRCACMCVRVCIASLSWLMNIECWHFFESERQFSEHSEKTWKWVSIQSRFWPLRSFWIVCVWPQLNCKCRARTTAISRIIVNHYLSPTPPPHSDVIFFFPPVFLPAERSVWKKLWQCVVLCAHVAPERWESTGGRQRPPVLLQATEVGLKWPSPDVRSQQHQAMQGEPGPLMERGWRWSEQRKGSGKMWKKDLWISQLTLLLILHSLQMIFFYRYEFFKMMVCYTSL